ncbi:MAG: DegT/DnrJ/EryC1/StrS family aminotransferase [Bdellovibrionota bacterium]
MTKKSIPFFNYPAIYIKNEQEYINIFKDVCSRGAFIDQKDLADFEKNLAEYVDCKYAIGVADGTSGLILALRAKGLNQGDEVIFASHTMVATASSIYYSGGIPVAVDCRDDRLIDPEDILRKITPRTRGIVPTQLNGRTCNMDEINKIATDHKLFIIEDAAQALGSKFKGKSAGTFGSAGMISFYPAKTLGCFGDGGAVFTNDDEMFRQMKLIRDHGRDPATGKVLRFGLNSRLDNLQAAILNFKLKTYPQDLERRRSIARTYQAMLGDLDQLLLPPGPDVDENHYDIYQNYEIEAERRDELKSYLAENGIGTIIQWGGSAVHQFEGLGFKCKLPRTEKFFKGALMLPMNTTLSDDDVEYIGNCVKTFYK